jgi:hypothetical protein
MASRGVDVRFDLRRGALLAALLLGLAACASPTPYQPADGGFGYADQQIETNRYRVAFAGNAVTPRTTVENYLLFRAAEVTLATGHDYFRVVDQNVERSTRYYGMVDPIFPYSFHRRDRFHNFYPLGYSTVTADPIDQYTAYADILVFEGEKPADDVNAYDARDVVRRLEPMVARADMTEGTP